VANVIITSSQRISSILFLFFVFPLFHPAVMIIVILNLECRIASRTNNQDSFPEKEKCRYLFSSSSFFLFFLIAIPDEAE
jgi:hypothetical protein